MILQSRKFWFEEVRYIIMVFFVHCKHVNMMDLSFIVVLYSSEHLQYSYIFLYSLHFLHHSKLLFLCSVL